MTDRNFDELFDRFHRNIKKNDKGKLRETLIREDLLQTIPTLEKGGFSVLDAGCGLGDMSIWLAQMGHRVQASDIAAKMVAYTQKEVEAAGLTNLVMTAQKPVQEALDNREAYDLICVHAVMEWLADPYAIIPQLLNSVKPGGHISLTIYNLHRSVFSALIKGDMKMIEKGHFGGSPWSLTPPNPILPEKLRAELEAAGFRVELQAGLRCFFDYYSAKVREERSYEEVLFLERKYRKQPPYRDIARYVHFLAKRPPL